MATNFVQDGIVLQVTAPAAVSSGDGVQVDGIFGVALFAAGNGEEVNIQTRGVFDLPKLSTDVVTQGDPLYWDNTNSRLTKIGTSNLPLAGYATEAAGNGVTTVNCLLSQGPAGPFVATGAVDFGNAVAGAIVTGTITVTGAATGDAVALAPPSTIDAGLVWAGFVSAANTVTIRLLNTTGGAIDPASATWGCVVYPV